MQQLGEIRKEHEQLLGYLSELDGIPNRNKNIMGETAEQLTKIFKFWDAHEKKEERLFDAISNDFPVKSMRISHKVLRGHWKVLNLALESHNDEKIKIALNTDGKMLAEKLKKHILAEERLFDKLIFTN